LKKIKEQLQDKIKIAMEDEVAKKSREVMKRHLITDVYDKYTPGGKLPYIRRYEDGGLLDDSNIVTEMINDEILRIENITTDDFDKNRYLSKIIETGIGYTWKDSDIYKKQPFPRPFMENTADELENGNARDALKKGLKRQGINAE